MANEIVPIIRDLNGTRLRIALGGTLLIDNGGLFLTNSGVATKAVDAAIALQSRIGTMHRSLITLTNKVISTVDATTNGAQGTCPLLTFPRGLILLLGATTALTLVGDGTGITATSAVVGAIGSVVPAVDVTLTSTEADFVPSTVCTLAASAGVFKGRGVTQKYFDNTTTTNATQLVANLNFATVDAGSTANGTITVNGTIDIAWINLGDQ